MEELIRRLRDLHTMGRLVGDCPAFQLAIRNLPAIAKSDAAVLITGETGTGKELVARAIHYLSERNAHPFVAVNCGGIPDTLLESELFGHERGAFTDAHAGRAGLIAQAHRGTFFLDEVDALTSRAQVTLLRVLQDQKYRAVGSSTEQTADVRVVAATNATLDELVQHGSFRKDLFYRLRIFSLHLPALRERREDIASLASHFVRKHSGGHRNLTLTPSALEALELHDWPGNVRELESAIIRGIAYSTTDRIEASDLDLGGNQAGAVRRLPAASAAIGSLRDMKREMIESFERSYLTQLMAESRGNVTAAARRAGKERRELGKLLRRYNLDPKSFHNVA